MKICLYLEFNHFLGGILYRKVGTGLLSSYKNQKVIMSELKIPFTEKWDNSCDILQINTPWLKSHYLIHKARSQKKKVIIWAHVTVEDAMQVFRFMPVLAPLFKRYLTYAYGRADIIFAPSEYTKKLLTAYGLPENKIIAMSNGVDLKKFYQNEELSQSGRRKYELRDLTVTSIGLAIPRKGTDTFLDLAKHFPKYQFRWFGKIYNKILVKPLPDTLPANVRFTGYIDNINEAYNSGDIFVFPSYEENEGMAVLEAAAIGLPILARDIPVYHGWLKHGENCLLAKDDQEFVSYLKKLIRDKDLRETLGKNAKLLAKSRSTDQMAKKAMEVYRNLIDR